MDHIRNSGVGRFHRLSEDSAKETVSHSKIEVLVTKTIELDSEAMSEDGDLKDIDAGKGPYGHGVVKAV